MATLPNLSISMPICLALSASVKGLLPVAIKQTSAVIFYGEPPSLGSIVSSAYPSTTFPAVTLVLKWNFNPYFYNYF